MELRGARVLVAGASGELGGLLATELAGRGARLALAGRDEPRLAAAAAATAEDVPTARFELRDGASCADVVAWADAALGGLDGLVIATGAVAFGDAGDLADEIAADLFAINVLGPIALIRAALPRLSDHGGIAALSAVVADHPTAGMAAYSASKAALSAYLAALRRELRKRRIDVLDVRPPHLDTTFSERALAGAPPALPEPHSAGDVARLVVDALAAGRREIRYDLKDRSLAIA